MRGGQSEHIKIVNSDRWINNRIYIMQLETLIFIMYEEDMVYSVSIL